MFLCFFFDRIFNVGGHYEYERIKKFEKNNVLGLVITTEIWIVFYNCFNAWFYHGPLDGIILIENMLFIRPTYMPHMWYMPVIIGVADFMSCHGTALMSCR